MAALKSFLRRRGEHDVLLLEADCAHARVSLHGELTTKPALACAAGEVHARLRDIADVAGGSRRPLRIALGSSWVATTTLDLPAMPSKELSLVLARRAAKLLSVPLEDVQFAARSLGAIGQEEQGIKEQRYLLAACSRSKLEPLRKEFARRGRRVTTVFPARLARLSYVCEQLCAEAAFAERRSAIVIDVEARAVVTSLISGNLLLSQAVLEGELDRVPTLPLAVVQELKNLDAFHRKVRRGEGVSSVFVIGMSGLRAKLFDATVRALMNEAAVRFEPSFEQAGDELATRTVSIQAAAHDGPFSLDLRAPIPLGNGERTVLAVGASIVVAGACALSLDVLENRELRALSERSRLQEQSLDLHELAANDLEFEESTTGLENEVARLKAISEIGFDCGDVLARIGSCMPEDALPSSISVAAPELQGEIHVRGRVSPDPAQAFRSLELLRARMEALPEIDAVRVEPDSVLEREDGREQLGLAFDLRATLSRPTP